VSQTQSLHDLVRKTGDGDPQAFEDLYLTMREPLLNFVRSRYHSALSQEDAEDVIHNLFARIPREAAHYRGIHNDASAKKWLYTLTRSEALRMIDAVKRFSQFDDGPRDTEMETDPAVPERSFFPGDLQREGGRAVEEQAMDKSIIDQVFAYVQSMSMEEQTIFIMRFVHHYTFEQIGQYLGRTKVRAKQIVDGLIERVREALGVDLALDDGSPSS
jgi:RNA polymerase sigma factor (sigma-70 family)